MVEAATSLRRYSGEEGQREVGCRVCSSEFDGAGGGGGPTWRAGVARDDAGGGDARSGVTGFSGVDRSYYFQPESIPVKYS